MTKEDEKNFLKADSCHICNKNILIKIFWLEIIVISLDHLEDQLIKTVILISE